MATTPAPTAEQQAIIDAAKTGGSLVIEAGAGTGKTSTLRMIAQELAPKRGLYIAYNKAIQVEASQSFPENVEARTAHSLAYREYGAKNRRRLSGQRMTAALVASILDIKPLVVKVQGEDDPIEINPRALAVAVKEAISRFCNSADTEPSAKHVPQQADIVDRSKYVAHVLPYVKAAWLDIINPKGRLSQPYFSHDCYLKMWSLSDPQLHRDFILFDEAQDANPAIAHVVEIQKDSQQIMVGDRAQAIYGWRGAVDAMQNFNADQRLFLSQSFRFGQAVAEHANRWLAMVGTPLRLTGFDKIDSKLDSLDSPDAILCRTNAGVIVSAMEAQERGQKVAITGGTAQIESFAKAASDLMDGVQPNHPELGIFRTWGQVQKTVRDGDATDLGPMVRIIDNYGVTAVLNVCRNSTRPEDADLIISTAHKAKGLEWDRVKIHGDFQEPKEGGKVSVTEAMLIYVAVTRAKQTLDASALAWLDKIEANLLATATQEESE